jgi:hypothetical protein
MPNIGDIIITNKFIAFIVKGKRLNKNEDLIFDTMTIGKRPQQRVVESKDVRYIIHAKRWEGFL